MSTNLQLNPPTGDYVNHGGARGYPQKHPKTKKQLKTSNSSKKNKCPEFLLKSRIQKGKKGKNREKVRFWSGFSQVFGQVRTRTIFVYLYLFSIYFL